jgi:hypothetical protein
MFQILQLEPPATRHLKISRLQTALQSLLNNIEDHTKAVYSISGSTALVPSSDSPISLPAQQTPLTISTLPYPLPPPPTPFLPNSRVRKRRRTHTSPTIQTEVVVFTISNMDSPDRYNPRI